MSYDVDAKCAHCSRSSAEFNITYNLSAMVRELGMYPYDFDGRPASEYAVAMANALQMLNEDFDRYNKLSAPNGWGTAAQLREHLPQWIKEFESAPACCVVSVS